MFSKQTWTAYTQGMQLSRKHKKYLSLIVAVISIVIYIGQQQGWFGDIAKQAETSQPGLYAVVRYVDGDTIVVDMNGQPETVRFVGADTPETHKPNTPVQCYGPAAAAYTKTRISNAGGKIRLQADPQSTDRDRYNRLLRYVYLPDGTLMEEALIRNGYGFYYPYFPFTKSADFADYQADAQKRQAGLWGNCQPTRTDRGGYVSNNAAK